MRIEDKLGCDSAELAARLYHAHHHAIKHDLPFWSSLAAQSNGPVLELGCGTGRVLLALAEAGYRVYGLDRDAGMLAVFSEQLPAFLAERVHFWRSDLGDFCTALQFSLVLLTCNTLSTLNTETRRRMFACLARQLSPGGMFAASRPNPTVLKRLPALSEPEIETDFPHPLSGEPVQVSSAWERSNQEFILRWHYDHLFSDGRVERLTLETKHDLNSLEVYQGELHAAGLELVETWGDFERSPYQPESPDLILVAKKP
ncbi:MAG TPA: class I SAM-dependent methyltransferase [Anaerolineales bacterium]|nr:class I SAM-dependent methyltransferase [Anaerolineales bacterium]